MTEDDQSCTTLSVWEVAPSLSSSMALQQVQGIAIGPQRVSRERRRAWRPDFPGAAREAPWEVPSGLRQKSQSAEWKVVKR